MFQTLSRVIAVLLAANAAGAAADAPIRIPAEGVTPPRLVHRVDPDFAGRAPGVKNGSIHLEIVVNQKGAVERVTVIRPLHPFMDQAAVIAVEQWRFEPAKKDGVPVSVIDKLEVGYHNHGAQSSAAPSLDDAPVRVVTRTYPRYPEEAKARRAQGVVVLMVDVNEQGKVSDIRVASPVDPLLDQAAIECVRKWKFAAARRNGSPVSVSTRVEIQFSMQK